VDEAKLLEKLKIIIGKENIRWKNDIQVIVDYGNSKYGEMEIIEGDSYETYRSYIGVMNVDGQVMVFYPKIFREKLDASKLEMLFKLLNVIFVGFETDYASHINIDEVLYYREINHLWKVLSQANDPNNRLLALLPLFIWIRGLERELRKGLYLSYREVTEERGNIKGKLLIDKQFKNDLSGRAKVWCKYNLLSPANDLNSSLYYFVQELQRSCFEWFRDEIRISNDIMKSMAFVKSVFDRALVSPVYRKVRFNRTNRRFESYYYLGMNLLALFHGEKRFISSDDYSLQYGKDLGDLSAGWLIEMTKLWEIVVWNILEYHLKDSNFKVLYQPEIKIGPTDRVPDFIILDRDNNLRLIVDAKYRVFNDGTIRDIMDQILAYKYFGFEMSDKREPLLLVFPCFSESFNCNIKNHGELKKWAKIEPIVREENNRSDIYKLKFKLSLQDVKHVLGKEGIYLWFIDLSHLQGQMSVLEYLDTLSNDVQIIKTKILSR